MTGSGTQAHQVLEATAVMEVVVAASPMDHFLGTFGVKQMDDALEEDLAVRNNLYLHFQSFVFLFISSSKSCQQILSFPCSDLPHLRKTHESSDILFEHAQHVARI